MRMRAMPVYLLWEWTNPKEEERIKKRRKIIDEVMVPYIEKKRREGIKFETLALSDNTRRMVELDTFETMENLDKIWKDEELQRAASQYSYLVNNMCVRILQPSIRIRP